MRCSNKALPDKRACLECHTDQLEYQRRTNPKKSLRDLRRQTVDAVKSKRGCVDCGETDPVVLDFHHIDPSTKLFTVATGVSKCASMDELLAEIDKCIVLCSNDHRRRHAKERK